jgi:hypothetical protein
MRVFLLTGFIIIFLLYAVLYSQDNDDMPDTTALTEKDSIPADSSTEDSYFDDYAQAAADSSWWYRKLENKAFGLGERLEFSVKYGKIPAGTAVMEISEIVNYENHECYNIKSIAHSNSVVSVFYKVRDTVQTYVDTDGIFPRKFRKKLKEGGYKIDRSIYFDQKNHLAIVNSDTIPTYAFVQDALSSLYFARIKDMEPGTPILIDTHTSKKNFPLQLNVLRREKIKVPAGEFNCIVVEPVMRAEGIFKAKGKIWIWLTDDQYKIPVFMKTEVFFLGSVTARLTKYTLGDIEEKIEQIQTD